MVELELLRLVNCNVQDAINYLRNKSTDETNPLEAGVVCQALVFAADRSVYSNSSVDWRLVKLLLVYCQKFNITPNLITSLNLAVNSEAKPLYKWINSTLPSSPRTSTANTFITQQASRQLQFTRDPTYSPLELVTWLEEQWSQLAMTVDYYLSDRPERQLQLYADMVFNLAGLTLKNTSVIKDLFLHVKVYVDEVFGCLIDVFINNILRSCDIKNSAIYNNILTKLTEYINKLFKHSDESIDTVLVIQRQRLKDLITRFSDYGSHIEIDNFTLLDALYELVVADNKLAKPPTYWNQLESKDTEFFLAKNVRFNLFKSIILMENVPHYLKLSENVSKDDVPVEIPIYASNEKWLDHDIIYHGAEQDEKNERLINDYDYFHKNIIQLHDMPTKNFIDIYNAIVVFVGLNNRTKAVPYEKACKTNIYVEIAKAYVYSFSFFCNLVQQLTSEQNTFLNLQVIFQRLIAGITFYLLEHILYLKESDAILASCLFADVDVSLEDKKRTLLAQLGQIKSFCPVLSDEIRGWEQVRL